VREHRLSELHGQRLDAGQFSQETGKAALPLLSMRLASPTMVRPNVEVGDLMGQRDDESKRGKVSIDGNLGAPFATRPTKVAQFGLSRTIQHDRAAVWLKPALNQRERIGRQIDGQPFIECYAWQSLSSRPSRKDRASR